MATRSSRLLTYDDYLALPEDGRRWQLFDGELVLSPSPSARHQKLVWRICTALEAFLAGHPLGEVYLAPFDVVLSPYRVVQPDVLFVSREHRDRRERRCVRGAPDLAIEVLSDGTRDDDLGRKRAYYARHGVQEVWCFEQDRPQVEIWRRDGRGRLRRTDPVQDSGAVETPLLPGFALGLTDLYRDLPD